MENSKNKKTSEPKMLDINNNEMSEEKQRQYPYYNMTTKVQGNSNSENALLERVFIERNSLLTEMFKIDNFRTIRNIFIALVVVCILQHIIDDLMEYGTIDLNFDLFVYNFGKLEIVLFSWIAMFLSTFYLVYYLFSYWANSRINYFSQGQKYQKLYDILWLIIYIIYIGVFIALPCYIDVSNKLPVASSVALLAEQIRMMMKTHAFVRSNIPRALENGRKKIESKNEKINEQAKNNNLILCPDISNYKYFLFAPTLVYRDSYPRNNETRWKVVFTNLFLFLCCVYYISFLFSQYTLPVFKDFNQDSSFLKSINSNFLMCNIIGTLLTLVVFFGLLHCWFNAWAEIMKFSDRIFYKDWWNSTDFPDYIRKWNVVVHDWLYCYIYSDLVYLLGKNKKGLCQIGIFLLSAFFHEYIIVTTLGFFYPYLFIQFIGFGLLCVLVKNKNFGNIIFWTCYFVGNGNQISFYSIEWYARQNCASSFDTKLLDFMIPRSFTCGMRNNSNLTDNFNNFKLNRIDL